jgi:sec-independent protein translocase protein TatA
VPFGSNIVSPTHLLLVLVVVLLVFGTKKLPELGRGIGSAMREFKDGVTGKEPPAALETQTSAPETGEPERAAVGASQS